MSPSTKKTRPLSRQSQRRPASEANFRLTSTKLFAGTGEAPIIDYRRDPTIRLPLIGGGVVILFSTLLLGITFKRLPPEIPLFYSRPWGEARLTVRYNLWLLPLISTLILGLNLLITHRLYRSDPLLAKILIWSGSTLALLLTLTLIQIVRLVSS